MSKKKTPLTDTDAGVREKRMQKEKNYVLWLSRIYVIFVFAIYPLYVGDDGYNNIVYGKASLYWGVSVTLFIIFTAFYLAYALGKNRELHFSPWYKRLNVADYALLAYLLVIILSCVFSPYKGDLMLGSLNRYDGFFTAVLMLLSFFVVSRWYAPKQLDFIIFAIGIIVVCIIGFLQFYDYDVFNLFPYTQSNMLDANGLPRFSGYSVEYRTTLGNINVLSCYTCMVVTMFTALYIRTKSSLRFLYLAVSVMGFIMMIMGGSDQGKVGVAVLLFLALPFWLDNRQVLGRLFVALSLWGFSYSIHHWIVVNVVFPTFTDSRPLRDLAMRDYYHHLPLPPIIMLSVVGLALGIALIVTRDKKWFSRKTAQIAGCAMIGLVIAGGVAGIEIVGKSMPEDNMIREAREMMHGNFDDNFGTFRVLVWKRAIVKIPELPLIGTGSDTFFQAFGEENQAAVLDVTGTVFDKAHNDYIQIAFCYGIIGLAAYLVFISGLLIKSVKPAYSSVFAFLSLCGVLAYLVSIFFGIDSVMISPIFWVLLGILRGEQIRFEEPQVKTG